MIQCSGVCIYSYWCVGAPTLPKVGSLGNKFIRLLITLTDRVKICHIVIDIVVNEHSSWWHNTLTWPEIFPQVMKKRISTLNCDETTLPIKLSGCVCECGLVRCFFFFGVDVFTCTSTSITTWLGLKKSVMGWPETVGISVWPAVLGVPTEFFRRLRHQWTGGHGILHTVPWYRLSQYAVGTYWRKQLSLNCQDISTVSFRV